MATTTERYWAFDSRVGNWRTMAVDMQWIVVETRGQQPVSIFAALAIRPTLLATI